ncbi:TlpA family protein disulfide reductase [Shumkonia mesophila]|uniref:TlpA family protein disulfide reductase n=1 Tax=Shumkonia mesophila TaxID=2838854 RepID=UPI0029347A75|nr:TlpA disulfide reductase family protein [Shumkonia mesophila]
MLAALLLVACDEAPRQAGRNASAPEIAALNLDGRPVRLADYAGKVLIINFWLGGCAACVQELPVIEAVHREHRDRGVVVLAVNVGGNADMARQLAAERGNGFENAVDELSLTATRYEVGVFPTVVVVDRAGRLRARMVGQIPKATLEAKVAALL